MYPFPTGNSDFNFIPTQKPYVCLPRVASRLFLITSPVTWSTTLITAEDHPRPRCCIGSRETGFEEIGPFLSLVFITETTDN